MNVVQLVHVAPIHTSNRQQVLEQAGEATVVALDQRGVTVGDARENGAGANCFDALGLGNADARNVRDAAPNSACASQPLARDRHTRPWPPHELAPYANPANRTVSAGDDDERVVGVDVRGEPSALLSACGCRDGASPLDESSLR